jgi:hypothetical protein
MRGFASRVVNFIADGPTRAMEISIGFIFMVNGVYVLSPFYSPRPGSAMAHVDNYDEARFLVGVAYFVLGAVAFLSSLLADGNLKSRRIAAMSLFLASLFALIFRAYTLGTAPTHWVFNLMPVVVFICDWLYINKCLLLQKV